MDENALRERVRKLMYENKKEGYSNLLKENYCYISPSVKKYPFQWFWDTFFHIYILCALGEYELSKKNLASLFIMQEADGFVGHMIYWKSLLPPTIFQVLQSYPTMEQIRPHMSALIQPTLAAQSLERIYVGTKDKAFLEAMLPKIKRYHEWLLANRSFEDNGLLFIISPFESGIDEKPSYDSLIGSHPKKGTFRQYLQLMRIDFKNFFRQYHNPRIYQSGNFIVKDTLFNTIYALDLFALSSLLKENNDHLEAARFELLAHKVSKSILELMYNEEDMAFYDLAGRENQQLKTLTFSIFFPMVLPDVPTELSKKLIERHLLNEAEFNLPYPLPSVARSVDVFNPGEARSRFFDFLWRGPTWVVVNWFLYRCLQTKGFEEMAGHIIDKTTGLIEKSGFREYYNPFTGEGYGAENFTWSGLIVDMLRMKTEEK